MFADNFNQEFSDIQSLNSIYLQLSIEENNNYDEINNTNLVMENIAKIYNKDFILIETKDLENDINQMNSSFVKLILACKEQNYLNVGNIFCVYCDFFNLDYIKVFNILHPNIKKIITNSYIKLVGKKEYINKKNKSEIDKDYKQPTIFQLFGGIKTKQEEIDDDEYFTEEEIEYQKNIESELKEDYFTEDEIAYQKQIELFKK